MSTRAHGRDFRRTQRFASRSHCRVARRTFISLVEFRGPLKDEVLLNAHVASNRTLSRRRACARKLAALPFVCASLACSDSPAAPTRGSLDVTIAGLPSGNTAAVTVTGPGNFSQALTATATLNDLAAGSYDVRAQNVTAGGVVFTPTPATQSIAVTGGSSATATVTYGVVDIQPAGTTDRGRTREPGLSHGAEE